MKRLLLPVLILSALAVGCKPASLAGTYKSDKGDLTLLSSGEFSLTGATAMPGNNEMKGKWTESGEKVALKPETVGGKPISEFMAQVEKMAKAFGAKAADLAKVKAALTEMDLTVDKDRKVLSLVAGPQTMTFTKAP